MLFNPLKPNGYYHWRH